MDKELLTQLVDKGLSTRAIAKETGKSQTTVRRWLKEHGLKTEVTATAKETGYKMCCKCNKNLTVDQFYLRKDGKRFSSYCKKCSSKGMVDKQKAMKKQCVDYKGGACVVCGYDKYLGALEFHHLDPTQKDFTLSHVRLTSFERVKSELDKCVLLCANCHREVHAGLIDLSDHL